MKTGSLIHNTVWMLFGNGARVLIQGLYFILMARALGVSGYGAFAGAVALVAVAAPFASLGHGNILIKHVSRDRSTFSIWWGNTLAMTLLSGVLLTIIMVLVGRWILPDNVPLLLIVLVSVADLIFVRLLDVSAQAFIAFERLRRTAQLQVVLSLSRLLAVAGMWLLIATPSVNAWGWCYLFSAIAGSVIGIVVVHHDLGVPKLSLKHMRKELLQGFYFSVSLSAQNVYNDIDKTMLSRYSSLADTGIYTAAYRLIDTAYLPVRSLLWASNPGFFQHGGVSLRSGIRYAGRLLPWVLVYGIGVGGILFVAAPIIPSILGSGYRDSVAATRWLAVLPVIRALHFFAADALTGADYQGLRTSIQIGVALFNCALNFWLIPLFSWRGAAWASCATDGLLAMSLWIAVYILIRDESRRRAEVV